MTEPGLIELDAALSVMGKTTHPGLMLAFPVAVGSVNRLIRGQNGEACILIACNEMATLPDLKLRNVKAQAFIRCQVQSPEGQVEFVCGTLIMCTAEDPKLRRLFLNLMEDALNELGDSPSPAAIAVWLQRIATLFVRLENEGRKRLRGLWAELLVILALGNVNEAVRRWHADPSETFDFTRGSFAIEVKSCQDLDRVHHFSLGQLRPPRDLLVWLASVVVRPDPQGASVLDLLAQIDAEIADTDTRHSLRLMVLSIGGKALEDDDLHRFDQLGAMETLRLFDIREIPSITEDIPEQVIAVNLQVRCRDLPVAGTTSEACIQLGPAQESQIA